ncbi:MAG: YggS family pyridoxal phosphate enzyme [Actinomycetia bacterium]|nr:YggS family pyridoxal phosphate enzyme [Actinomycetes bacterium]
MTASDAVINDALVAERLAEVRARIVRAGGTGVTVLPVTKSFPIDACWAAYRAGCPAVGENYAQEVVAKLGGRDVPFAVHFIGQLQTNKVRALAPIVALFGSIDRSSQVRELAKRVPGARILVQVNAEPAAGDGGKAGCPILEVPALVELAAAAGLHVEGLMAIGPTVGGPEAARPLFRSVRALATRLELATCSMGMSDDLEVAVQEGSTQVRIGTALFGKRPQLQTLVR